MSDRQSFPGGPTQKEFALGDYKDIENALTLVHQDYITEQIRLLQKDQRKIKQYINLFVVGFIALTVSHVLESFYVESRLAQKVNKRKWVEGIEDRS